MSSWGELPNPAGYDMREWPTDLMGPLNAHAFGALALVPMAAWEWGPYLSQPVDFHQGDEPFPPSTSPGDSR